MKAKVQNYQLKLIAALGAGLPADGVGHVTVAHDKTCGVFAGRECNCTPDITINTGGQVSVVAPDGSVSRKEKVQ